ncbi:hypothetical protein HPP92_021977 [Vanilla planifolia]|uniref:Uncharacterized protein n=1 Tax=Vanilla planifolia TaxID=51239 RepID=A0A835PWG6_VANPL|nr:hypothetical protein HPP92_021977 [Vanilla planifolia]
MQVGEEHFVSLGDYATNYFDNGIAIGAFHAILNGISVVASSGNSGPDLGTINRNSLSMLMLCTRVCKAGILGSLYNSQSCTYAHLAYGISHGSLEKTGLFHKAAYNIGIHYYC